MNYSDRLKDPRWKEKRLEIIERDNCSCRWCGKADNLEVHHSIYFGIEPWEYKNEMLITLCNICHSETERLLHEIKCYLCFIQIENVWELDNIRVMLRRYLVDKKIYNYEDVNMLINEKR